MLYVGACSVKVTSNLIQFDMKNLIGNCDHGNYISYSNVVITIFSDGSLSKINRQGGWGSLAVVGNLIIGCVTRNIDIEISGLEMELTCLVHSLRMAQIMECSSAIFFSDSIDTVWALQSGNNPTQITNIFRLFNIECN